MWRVIAGVLFALASSCVSQQATEALQTRSAQQVGSDRRKLAEFKKLAPRFEGVEAIYKEGSICALVRIQDIQADEQEMKANVVVVEDLASTRPLQAKWTISTIWDGFSFGPDSWHVAMVSYHVFFDPAIVVPVKARAKELSGIPALAKRDKLDVMMYELGRKR